MGAVSDIGQITGSAFTVAFLQDCLIRIFAKSKILYSKAGEHLEFRIDSSGPYNWDGEITGSVVS